MAPKKGSTCIRSTTEDRLKHYSKPDPVTGCWVWVGSTVHGGYGQTTMGDGKPMKAHRVSYLTFVGPIADGLMVCHKCDNPPCVNPDHLFLGTAKDNQRDSIRKDRNARGSRHWASRLTEADVAIIREHISAGASDAWIANRFDVVPGTIHHIRHGNSWKHIQ